MVTNAYAKVFDSIQLDLLTKNILVRWQSIRSTDLDQLHCLCLKVQGHQRPQ